MTTPPPDPSASVPPEAERSSGKGCLVGGCLIPTVLLLVVVIGGFFAVRALLERKLPEWEDRYPIVDLAATILGVQAGGADNAEPLERVVGSDDPAMLPDDLVTYPRAEAETFTVSGGNITGYQRSGDLAADLETYFTTTMPSAGWVLQDQADVPGGTALTWTRGGDFCAVEIIKIDNGSEAWIRCSVTG